MKMKRPGRRILSCILAAVLLIGATRLEVLAEVIAELEIETEEESDVSILCELEEERSTYSKSYLLSDNSREVLIFPEEIHYEDEDGNYQEIDNSLHEINGTYVCDSNGYTLSFGNTTLTRGTAEIEKDGYKISWKLLDKQDKTSTESDSYYEVATSALKSENSTSYKDIDCVDSQIFSASQSTAKTKGYRNGIYVEQKPTADGVKENIIIPRKNDWTEFVFSMNLEGLCAEKEEDNTIVFYDSSTGEPVFYLPAPFMYDANNYLSFDVSYEIIKGEVKRTASPSETGNKEVKADTPEKAEDTEACAFEEEVPDKTEESIPSDGEIETEHEGEQNETTEETTAQETIVSDVQAVSGSGDDADSQIVDEYESITPVFSENSENTSTKAQELSEQIAEESSVSGESEIESSGIYEEAETQTAPEAAEEESIEETQSSDASEAESQDATDKEAASNSDNDTQAEGETEHTEADNAANTQAETVDSENMVLIRIVPDNEWLENATYPVTIDPTVKQYRKKNRQEFYSIDSNGATNQNLYVGKKDGTISRSFVLFDLPPIPANSLISEAYVYTSGMTNDQFITVSMVKSDSEESSSRKLTWEETDPSRNSLLDYARLKDGQYFNITKAVRQWNSGESPNLGLVFSAYDENKNCRNKLQLKDNNTKPYLKIVYRTSSGLESYWGTHSVSAGTAGAASINDHLGYLTVANTDVSSIGSRFPLSISHVYNSNDKKNESKWHLNYEETIKIPINYVDITEYPYLYTDSDGTEHFFKRSKVSYLNNGQTKTVEKSEYAAEDEDGLGLYIVPVDDKALKDQYPLKLVNKSSGMTKYFDQFGRLAMITDSNQYENAKNQKNKERNRILIEYTIPENMEIENDQYQKSLKCLASASEAFGEYNKYLSAKEASIKSDDYPPIRDAMAAAVAQLKNDPYVQSSRPLALKVRQTLSYIDTQINLGTSVSISASKARANKIGEALNNAKTEFDNQFDSSKNCGRKYFYERITAVKDASDVTAVISYDESGQIESITDPSDTTGFNYGKNTYEYEDGNLIKITFANGKTAKYEYADDSDHLLTAMISDSTARIDFTYSQNSRITQVSETSMAGNPGQTYSITYNSDNTTTYRFSGVDDEYNTEDDIENVYVFDEQGKTLCAYSKRVDETKVIGAVTGNYSSADDSSKNKLNEVAATGTYTGNILRNHSFEKNDNAWTAYKEDADAPEKSAINQCSSKKAYLGSYGALVDLTKRSKGTAGFKQSAAVDCNTAYTFSAYCNMTGNTTGAKAYIMVTDTAGNAYKSDVLSENTPPEFDNGWERLSVSFCIDADSSKEEITVALVSECTEAKNKGYIIFDCAQLEKGDCVNNYNLIENGSFEDENKYWTFTGESIQIETLEDNEIDEEDICHLVGTAGKDTYIRFSTNLSGKNAFVLSGWAKAESSPVRTGRQLEIEVKGQNGAKAKTAFNVYTEGWQYFTVILPAKNWGSTSITCKINDCIGDLYLDGIELVRNDVQTRQYNADGRLISSYTAEKEATATYDAYGRTKTQTSASGEKATYTYAGNNELTRAASSIGPTASYTYDKYGHQILTTVSKDNSPKIYSKNQYSEDGRFLTSEINSDGQTTSYTYNTTNGRLEETVFPERNGLSADARTVKNKHTDLRKESEEGTKIDGYTLLVSRNNLGVLFTYDSLNQLSSINPKVNPNEYDASDTVNSSEAPYSFDYDEFGRLRETKIAGNVIKSVNYAGNHGKSISLESPDGITTSAKYDEYGRTIASVINDKDVQEYYYNNKGYLDKTYDITADETRSFDYNTSGKTVRSSVFSGNTTSAADLESRIQYTYAKDGQVSSLSYQEQGDPIKTYSYTYDKAGAPTKLVLPDKSTETITYDALRRVSRQVYAPISSAKASKQLYTSATYKNASNQIDGKTSTTTSIKSYVNKFGTNNDNIVVQSDYTYDSWGNITEIHESGSYGSINKSYEYDGFAEITKAVEGNRNSFKTYTYRYDTGGNIESETILSTEIFAKTLMPDSKAAKDGKTHIVGSVEQNKKETTETHNYEYDDTWTDMLIKYDEKEISYDEYGMGRPVNYMGDEMSWNCLGKLESISSSGNSTLILPAGETASFTYFADGKRKTKTVNDIETTYHYNNGMLLSETRNNETLYYYYGDDGKIISIGYKKGTETEDKYFLVYNGQGDVIAVYRNSDSALMGTYQYDLWGKLINTFSTIDDKNKITLKNPIRYRSYYYDGETGLYYLNARYYDPSIRRFINADSLIPTSASTPQEYNMFAYCCGNPVMLSDPSGNSPFWPWLKGLFGVNSNSAQSTTPTPTATPAPTATPQLTKREQLVEKAWSEFIDWYDQQCDRSRYVDEDVDWCAYFVAYCIDPDKKLQYGRCHELIETHSLEEIDIEDIQPGDLVFFVGDWHDENFSEYAHVGIIREVPSSDRFYTIEGNHSSCYREGSYVGYVTRYINYPPENRKYVFYRLPE